MGGPSKTKGALEGMTPRGRLLGRLVRRDWGRTVRTVALFLLLLLALTGKYIPAQYVDRVLEKYWRLPDPTGDPAEIERLPQLAREKGADWKGTLIERSINIVRADRRIKQEELATVQGLATKIGATEECALVLRREFGSWREIPKS